MFLSSFLGAIFMMGPVLPVFVVMPGIGRAAMDQLTACWEHFTAVSKLVTSVKVQGPRKVIKSVCVGGGGGGGQIRPKTG